MDRYTRFTTTALRTSISAPFPARDRKDVGAQLSARGDAVAEQRQLAAVGFGQCTGINGKEMRSAGSASGLNGGASAGWRQVGPQPGTYLLGVATADRLGKGDLGIKKLYSTSDSAHGHQ
jgi:hypothetical protein